MEIKQDLIMNFDFRTYCANFFAGQSKTAAEVVAEFERITHTTELFQIEPRAEDRLFILDADGLKAADGATFLFVAGRNMRVSYDNERKDIDINDAASIEMSVLQELSWNVDLYTDSWGYQVEGQGVYNFLANQSQFLELTDEEYNNDNITKPDFTLNIEGKNNSTTQYTSYAIPHFLWNTHLIYNSGDK